MEFGINFRLKLYFYSVLTGFIKEIHYIWMGLIIVFMIFITF